MPILSNIMHTDKHLIREVLICRRIGIAAILIAFERCWEKTSFLHQTNQVLQQLRKNWIINKLKQVYYW